MRRFTEMNEVEKECARDILINEGWSHGTFTNSEDTKTRLGWTKGLVSAYETDIMIGEDAWTHGLIVSKKLPTPSHNGIIRIIQDSEKECEASAKRFHEAADKIRRLLG